jgi:hypothetical protein
MGIFDFITQDQIDDLPDDDPQSAFIAFVRIAQRRLGEITKAIDTSSQESWTDLEDARHGFMNVVIAAAKKYQIEPFVSLSVPRLENFDEKIHRQFQSDLDHYMTQLLLDNSSRSKRDSVFISSELRSSVRSYTHHLRQLIEKADDIDDGKRQALLRKLSEFEQELEKKRLSLLAVTIFAITLLSAPGGIGASADMASRLVTGILRSVGEARVADEAVRRLPSSEAPMAITGPRPNDAPLVKQGSQNEMDDDIPF